jgi:hypothetical protein
MLPDLLDSLLRPASYRRFSREASGRTTAYVAFLAAIFIGAFGFAAKLRLAPLFNETFTWLETAMPALRVEGGKVVGDPPGPMRLEHPKFKELALEIDTTRKDPVTPKMMDDLKVRAYLTSNALYLDNEGQVEALDLTRSGAEKPTLVNAESYKEMARTFDWVFYPALLLLMFLLFALWLAAFGLLYALAGLIMASIGGAGLGFGALLRLALHAQTAAALLYALDSLLPFPIPGLVYAAPALSLGYLWLGIRAAAGPGPDAPAAAPPAAVPPAA